jgi:uncharacterized protein YggE
VKLHSSARKPAAPLRQSLALIHADMDAALTKRLSWACAQVGANQMSGIGFDFDQPKARQNEARKLAVADARAKAELYAAAARVNLGRVMQISETVVFNGPYPAMAVDRMAAAESSVPIAAGQQTLSANILTVYEI